MNEWRVIEMNKHLEQLVKNTARIADELERARKERMQSHWPEDYRESQLGEKRDQSEPWGMNEERTYRVTLATLVSERTQTDKPCQHEPTFWTRDDGTSAELIAPTNPPKHVCYKCGATYLTA